MWVITSDLSGIADVYLNDIVTSFKGDANSGSENDLLNFELWVHNVASSGQHLLFGS